MANEQTGVEWLTTLQQAIKGLVKVEKDASADKLKTADDFLAAARTVDDAVRLLDPPARDAGEEPAPSVVTALVRASREPAEGKGATWNEAAEKLGLAMGQRAFDKHAPNRVERLKNTRERVYRHRDPNVVARSASDLPGLSSAEIEAELSCSRTKIRALVAEGKLHAFPLKDSDNNVVTVRRAGKEVPSLRYYLDGVTAKEAAAALDASEAEVAEMGTKGLIGRSLVLKPEDLEPVLDSDGNPVWQYFPDHRSPAAG